MLNIQFAKNMLENEEGMNHLLVKVKPEEVKTKINKPVAFVLVVDASYSMNGNVENHHNRTKLERNTKLDYVKQASERLLDMMKDGSKLGIVSFSNLASLDYPLTTLNQQERNNLRDRIHSIKVRGATNISDALELASNQIPKEVKENYHVKLILLSDGEANHGITDVEGISTLSNKLKNQEISISTIGVGVDYNSFFMESIATASGGMFYHLEKMEQLNEIFTKELEMLTTLTTKHAKLFIETPKGIKLSNNLNGFSESKLGEIFLGNLFNEQNILLEIFTEKEIKIGTQTIKIRLEYINTEGNKQAIEKEVSLKIVPEEEMDNVETNEEVIQLVKDLMEAKTKKEAIRYYENGDFNLIEKNLTNHRDKFSKLGNAYNFDTTESLQDMVTLKEKMITRSLNKENTKELYSQSYSVMRNDKKKK